MINIQQEQDGMSLIELLIAMLIGVLMMTAAIGLLISNKRVYKEQNEMGRLQENARYAIEILTNDIRMAAYAGCVDDVDLLAETTSTKPHNKATNAGTVTNLHNFANPIEGIDGKTAASTWFPSASNEMQAKITNGTDALTLRYLDPIESQVVFTPGGTTIDNNKIDVTCSDSTGTTENCSANHITPGENMAITDCGTGDIFIATGSTATTITHGATLQKTYDDSAQVSRYVTTRYYIGTAEKTNYTGDAIPALYRYITAQDTDDCDADGDTAEVIACPQELIEGVERMEILYGVDTNADSIPDIYLPAGGSSGGNNLTSTSDWSSVISVRLTLLVRTINENFNIDEDDNTYTLLDAAAYDPADEHLRRRVFTTTVQIRNRGA
jgi:type IV pilus assembly protein PilW